jgi:outer membrane protein assembly factor BamB
MTTRRATRRLGVVSVSMIAIAGLFVTAVGSAAAATPPTYAWPYPSQNSSLTSTSADPTLSTANAGSFGVHWMTNTGSEVLSSPVVAYNTTLSETLVYVTTIAGLVTAYNQATGLPVWSVNMGGSIVSSPLAEGAYLWVAMQHGGRIYKLDSANGSVACSASSPIASSINSSPTLATPPGGKPTVYIGINDVGTINGPVVAIDEATCDRDFSSHPEPGAGTGGVWDFISYAVDGTGEPLVIFGTADPDSAVYAIDAVTGKLVWRYAIYNPPPGTYDVGAGVTISPPGANGFADGVAYAHSKYGDAYALDLTTGALIWQYDFGSPSISTAALSGTNLVFGDGGGAIDLNAVTGALIWQSSGNSSVLTDGAPAIVGPVGSQIVAFGDLDGTFHILSLATGDQLYSYQTGNYLSASVAETDGNLLIAGSDGFLYDFAPGGGNPPGPTTSVSSPAQSSIVTNPGGPLTVSGTASSGSDIGAVDVAIQQDGGAGMWWDSVSGTWVPEPYPNRASLTAPDSADTHWSVTVPTTSAGGGLTAYASAVDIDGVADIASEQSPPTPARSSFTVNPVASAPVISVASPWIGMDATFAVTGHGFGDHEAVSLALNGITLGTATANAAGTLSPTSFTVPTTDNFGPQTLVASGKNNGKPATSASVYVTNAWSQYREGATHSGYESDDQALNHHLGLFPPNYLEPTWSFNAGSAVAGSVDVVHGVAYLADASGAVDAVNVQTGVQRWSTDVAGTAKIDTTPAVVGNLVIVGSVNQRLYGVDTSTGKVVWSTFLRGALESSPSSAGGDVYVGDDNGDVYSLTASTGKVIWRARASGKVKGSPAVDTAAGLVVVGDGTGVVRGLALSNGAARWTYATGGAITDPALIDAGSVFIGSSDAHEYALNESTGKLRWKYATAGPDNAPTTLSGTDVIVGSGSSMLYLARGSGAVDGTIAQGGTIVGTAAAENFAASELSDGTVRGARPVSGDPEAWDTGLPTTLASSPTIINGEVFATGNDGTVQCWTVPGMPAV